MLLVIDIGNTNVVLGVYDGAVLKAHWRLATNAKTTSDEYGILLTNLLASAGLLPVHISAAIMSSVVPALTSTFETLIQQYFHQRPMVVTAETDTGLRIRYANPKEIGSDRLVWSDAALVGYLFGVIFAVFGVVYRYAVWLRRPPTAGDVERPGRGPGRIGAWRRAEARHSRMNFRGFSGMPFTRTS